MTSTFGFAGAFWPVWVFGVRVWGVMVVVVPVIMPMVVAVSVVVMMAMVMGRHRLQAAHPGAKRIAMGAISHV